MADAADLSACLDGCRFDLRVAPAGRDKTVRV